MQEQAHEQEQATPPVNSPPAMSSATSKKPPTPGAANARRPSANPVTSTASANSTTPARSPSRMNSSTGSGTTGTGSAASPAAVNRTKSVRAGAPLSARAAARKPASSSDDSDAKAEMQAKLDDMQEQLRLAEEKSNELQKQTSLLQAKLDESQKEQGTMEESLHEQSEQINDLENDKKESLRARRELEQAYENEKVTYMREREEAQAREEEMQASTQRLRESLAQREVRAGLDDERKPGMSRNSSFRNSMTGSPNQENAGQFAPPSSMQRSDSRSSSKLVMQKDKIIESLRLELAETHIKVVELENLGGGRLQQLDRDMYDIKMQNARLMEENESFQLLLSEKTLNGDFSQSELLRAPSHVDSRPSSRHNTNGNSLADELGDDVSELEPSDDVRRLQAEVSAAKDQNKALTLYINNIISRLLQHEQFEQILDKTPDIMSGPSAASTRAPPPPAAAPPNTEKELPPPPPPKDDEPAGFLQRAKSVIGGRKPRPQSQVLPPTTDYTTNPDQPRPSDPPTAPQIPLGRSNSRRAPNTTHRRANSEWAPASVINSMYRGASPPGPTSPGLTSPSHRSGSFFATPAPFLSTAPGQGASSRIPSGSSVPTIAETSTDSTAAGARAENSPPPQRDSKISNPNRASLTSNPASSELSDPLSNSNRGSVSITPAEFPPPSSPPRSVTSSGESRGGNSGAVMMGSKMRPLRLVKEAEESEMAKKAANRGSWFGWMNKGGVPPQQQQQHGNGQ